MRGASLSVMGIYQYDNTIFDGLRVPEGADRDALIQKILLDTVQMSTTIPDADWLKLAITAWCDSCYDTWVRVYNTTTYDYNPFENYDMTEEYSHTRIPDLTQTSVNSGEDTSNSYINGFDGGLVQNGRAIAQLGTNNTISNTGTESKKYIKKTHGDASLRAVPEVIEKERAEKMFNWYNWVVNDFMCNFCNLAYNM
mgnify:CR=1 FL=1